MSVNVSLYTKPNCQACKATKRHLDRLNIQYKTVDISVDSAALEFLTEQGFQAAPVVMVHGRAAWSGYQPERIDAIASLLARE